MYKKETVVVNATGIHARPASIFTQQCKKFESKIIVTNLNTGKSADTKSIIKVMALALSKGTPISIEAEGADEIEAVDTVIALVDSGFGEEG